MLKNGWSCGIELVTPEVASRLLENNEGNRRIRPSVVTKYAAAMLHGNWKVTPEPIVISNTGRLMNGQHRLHAVIKSGVSISLFVVRGVDVVLFEALDRGATRSAADALGIDKKLAEVCRLAALISKNRAIKSGNNVLDSEIKEMADILGDEHSSLMSACRTSGKTFSSAPIVWLRPLELLLARTRTTSIACIGTWCSPMLVSCPDCSKPAGSNCFWPLDQRFWV